jgi:hypothetical protein
MDRLSYFVADDGRCLRCGAAGPKKEEVQVKSKKSEVRKLPNGDVQVKGFGIIHAPKAEVRNVKTADGTVVDMKFRDQTAECMHQVRIEGNKQTCLKCSQVRHKVDGTWGPWQKPDEAPVVVFPAALKAEVLRYLVQHKGVIQGKGEDLRKTWHRAAKELGISDRRLGVIVAELLDEGTITHPDIAVANYRLARPKVSRKAA